MGAPRRVTNASLVLTALTSACLGALFCICFVYPWAYTDILPDAAATAVAVHLVAAATTLVVVAGGVTLMFRGDPALRLLVRFTVIGMAVGGAISVAPTMRVARAWGYSSATPVVLIEIAMVLAFLITGISVARCLAVRGSSAPAAPA